MKQFQETNVNIGIRERKLRRILGIVFLLISIILTYIFANRGTDIWWGLILFPLWYQGIRFLYDYSTGTCPLKAELGQSRLDAFMSVFGEPIEDKELEQKIRTISRKALFRSLSAAFLLTSLSLILIATF